MNSSHSSHDSHNRAIAVWLMACCTLVFAMVIIGGLTRLTESGLSMVDWDPIMRWLPPTSQAEWQVMFEKYQSSPEFRIKNNNMDVEAFKGIFWLEFFHRLFGRMIGFLFLLPFLFFLMRGMIRRSLIPKLVIMFILGGMQGVVGWLMVKSGLVDAPHVSQYRLTAHLGMAFLIYAYMLWVALGLYLGEVDRKPTDQERGILRFSWGVTTLIFITAMSGGFVAGLKAGKIYNTFPDMGGQWIPDELLLFEPAIRNFFENPTTVQWDHRLLALMVAITIPIFWVIAQKRPETSSRARLGLHLMLGMMLVQLSLGISTLLLSVPLVLAVAHQGGALILLTFSLFVTHQLRHHTQEVTVGQKVTAG